MTAAEGPGPGAAPLPYQYVTLRAVPRVEREEFVNVGVVVFCQEADVLDVAYHLDEERLRSLHPAVDLDALRRALEQVDRVARGERGTGLDPRARLGARFGWIAAPRSTVLQPGPRHGGTTPTPNEAAHRLLDRLVGP